MERNDTSAQILPIIGDVRKEKGYYASAKMEIIFFNKEKSHKEKSLDSIEDSNKEISFFNEMFERPYPDVYNSNFFSNKLVHQFDNYNEISNFLAFKTNLLGSTWDSFYGYIKRLGLKHWIYPENISFENELLYEVQTLTGQILEVNEDSVVVNILISKDKRIFQKRKFDIAPIKGALTLENGELMEIMIRTRAGERQFIYRKGKTENFVFDNPEEQDDEAFIKEVKSSSFFDATPKTLNEDDL